MTDFYPYHLLQPEHREEMAAWLEDGQQPANTTLRAAIVTPRDADHLDPLVREVRGWLRDHAPVTAYGYRTALLSWPTVLAKGKGLEVKE